MKFVNRGRRGVSSIVGSIFFVLIMIVAIASLVTIFNSFTAYNQQVNKASNSNLQAADTQLSVTGGQFGAFPPSTTSNFNVATACTATATSPTNREKVFYAANMWWEFYTCNAAYQYSSSFDGVTWQAETSIPGVITTGYAVGPDLDVEVVGTTLYLAIARVGAPDFQLAIGTLSQGGTSSAPAGTISWTDPPSNVVITANAFGPINLAVDSAGNQWVAVVQGVCTTALNCNIGVYEHEACAAAANQGWEPNACASATNPNNYAPAALTGLSVNTHTIVYPAISTYSTTGMVLLYEYGSTVANTIGTLGLVTQTTLASAAWTAITLTGISPYSLTSSSATLIGSTVYVAGLTGAVGATTGTLDFWTLPFTSMTAGTPTAQQQIEGTSRAWIGALASSGTTLALFDNPAAGAGACPAADLCVQYYTSSTLGSLWSSAILLESAETAVTYLSPAEGTIAVTWTNTADNVRFAAPSVFTLTNDSPFSVHIVDAYVYQPSTNALVAHWYYNTTGAGAEDFDYWVGQGSTVNIPIRFVWAADTSYLITFSTDAGVTAQTTLTTLPGGTVSCPSGEFFSEISPSTVCTTSPYSTTPYLISGAGTTTCTDTTAGTALMAGLGMGYTTTSDTSGTIYLSFAFEVTTPAASGISTAWHLYYGAGANPACGAAATGTAIGQTYNVDSQSATAAALSQSVSSTLSGLAPSTTYWFDVQTTDSSGATWTFSNPDAGLVDVGTTESPNLATSTNANTCTDVTSGAARMVGLGTTFTTGGAGFTGSVFGKLSFNVAGAATSGINTKFLVRYGTGAAPACNAAAAGTAYGNTYTFTSEAAFVSSSGQKVGFVLTGLAASTTYWVDVQALDSTVAAWVYSNPTLATMEMPTADTNLLPTVGSDSTTNTCAIATAATTRLAGFATSYTIPTSAVGDLYITLTFQVTTPANNNVNSQWQVVYAPGNEPVCNDRSSGIPIGNTFEIIHPTAAAGAFSQSETIVIQNVEKLAGSDLWLDLQIYDSSAATWTYSNPEISVAMFPA